MRVIPRARHSALAGTRGDALLVRLAAPPVDGAANDALVAFLAGLLGVPRSAVHLVSGQKSRTKRVVVTGLTEAQVRVALGV